MNKVINLGLSIGIGVSFTGCILTHPGCIRTGNTGASECARYAERYDSIERYKTELNKLNKNVNLSKFGKKLSDREVSSFNNRFCKKYEGKKLPVSKDLASSFKINSGNYISLGDYYRHKFCQTHFDKKELGLFEKTTRTSTNHGYITWYITDGKKVYGYKHANISYFANGVVKYGSADFDK